MHKILDFKRCVQVARHFPAYSAVKFYCIAIFLKCSFSDYCSLADKDEFFPDRGSKTHRQGVVAFSSPPPLLPPANFSTGFHGTQGKAVRKEERCHVMTFNRGALKVFRVGLGWGWGGGGGVKKMSDAIQ